MVRMLALKVTGGQLAYKVLFEGGNLETSNPLEFAMKDILRSLWMTVFLVTLMPFQCFGATENLDEMANRISRIGTTNTFSYQYMENAGNHYLWQPETLRYSDVLYGTEVWKIVGSGLEGNEFQDISFPQFSADGKYIVFRTDRNTASL